ncbi:sensor histidine kinase [Chitinophaga sancti]|uniref:histidine kinase n=1 Tax=Chitinophaga sancti TaxID=1004 RepID=A0A1K1RJG4_9BACT|nr:sensor histidine kinase [Chitinophaga sancti]WQD60669.1 CHASE3 domain-containing protein [Chitinophaga sancti]WQG87203.1 CHASE3 domain-containing protein [Chitinophaga sancti]SFW71838.1 His Kinase A (phospho-acceptor) domain-containing protein [Chitinophaga sancti]
MHIPVQKKLRAGFFIAATVMIIASVCSYIVTKNLLDNAKWMNHTIEVSKRLEVITKQVKDAEAAIRGFSITRDTAFLRPSMLERSIRIEEEYLHLREVTKRSPQQQLHLDTLKQLLDNKYKQLAAGETKWRSFKKDTSSVQEGEKSMDKIDRKVQDMMKIEEGHLQNQSEMQRFYSMIWAPVIFITSLIAIFIGIYSYVTLTREYRLQLHIESRLKSYQRDLQQNISLLNKSNEELEQFAYVASHDLQEPLRKISTFSDRLQMKYGTLLPAEANELLDRMGGAVTRMRVLINDLLIFSRAGRITPDNIVKVDLNILLQQVSSDLEERLQEKKGTIRTARLPVIEGHPTALQQLFQNILTNAIKFASPERNLEINVNCQILKGTALEIPLRENQLEDTFCRLSFEDNGIGFEPAYAERIFLLFQRLHGMSEYSGTGIGLAICKKITDSHHGFIKAHGEVGKGASFIVILPITQTHQDEQY